jgi:hypothetical protein
MNRKELRALGERADSYPIEREVVNKKVGQWSVIKASSFEFQVQRPLTTDNHQCVIFVEYKIPYIASWCSGKPLPLDDSIKFIN